MLGIGYGRSLVVLHGDGWQGEVRRSSLLGLLGHGGDGHGGTTHGGKAWGWLGCVAGLLLEGNGQWVHAAEAAKEDNG